MALRLVLIDRAMGAELMESGSPSTSHRLALHLDPMDDRHRIGHHGGFLAIIAALVVSHATKPYARLFWSYAWPLLLIALLISLASSAFYMRRLKAESDDAIAEL